MKRRAKKSGVRGLYILGLGIKHVKALHETCVASLYKFEAVIIFSGATIVLQAE